MKIVVVGGTGLIGSRLVDLLESSGAEVVPASPSDVVVELRDVVLGRPQLSELEVVGPDSFRLTDIAGQILAANEDGRTVVPDPAAPYFGALLEEDSLLPGDHPRFTPTRFEDWLRAYVGRALPAAV